MWQIRHEGTNAAARPLYENDLLYLTGGGARSLMAIRPGGSGALGPDSIVWQTSKRVPYRSSQLVIGDRLYMVSDQGVASCLDALTGKAIWTERLGAPHWASPIYADGKIYYSSKEGTVTVIEAADKFNLLAENEFPDGFNASPAVAEGSLILRSFTHLYRVGRKPRK